MATGQLFILDDHDEPRPCADVHEWARWLDTFDWRVAEDLDEDDEHGGRVRVSTMFVGLDPNYRGEGPPVLWETLVFGGPLAGATDRYTSKAAARVGHQAMCQRVRDTLHRR